MRLLMLISLLCFFAMSYSQKNSNPYINKSIIKIHSSNEDLIPHLLDLNVIPMSCRGAILESNLIVDSATVRFLQSALTRISLRSNCIASFDSTVCEQSCATDKLEYPNEMSIDSKLSSLMLTFSIKLFLFIDQIPIDKVIISIYNEL